MGDDVDGSRWWMLAFTIVDSILCVGAIVLLYARRQKRPLLQRLARVLLLPPQKPLPLPPTLSLSLAAHAVVCVCECERELVAATEGLGD